MDLLKSITGESYNPDNDPRFENKVFNPNKVDLEQKNFLANNFEERLLQENMQIAAKQGLTRMRYPTMETTARIQGYPSVNKREKFDRDLEGMDRARNAESLDMQSLPAYLWRMSNIHHTPRLDNIKSRLIDLSAVIRSNEFIDAQSTINNLETTLNNLETGKVFYEGAERAAYDSKIAQVQKELASLNKKRSAVESDLQVLKKELDEMYDSPEFKQALQNKAKPYDNLTPLDNYPEDYHGILRRAENIGKHIKRVTGKEPTLDTDVKGNT